MPTFGHRAVLQPLHRFLRTEAASAVALVAAAVAALVWVASPWADAYERLWSTEAVVGVGSFALRHDLRHWVNDGAMTLFFFVVGLEIKRELVHGSLRDRRAALLPVACAVGGMAAPALVFAAFTAGTPGSSGWGIPTATDIAFPLAVLALVGRRTPLSLKAFLLTLAIVDDIGAITLLAVVYRAGVSWWWLAGAGAGLGLVVVLRRLGVRSLAPFTIAGAGVWLMTVQSGVHATLAGVALALLTPAHPAPPGGPPVAGPDDGPAAGPATGVDADEAADAALLDAATRSRGAASPMARLEAALHPWSAWLVLPLFALANAGVALTMPSSGDATRVTVGVALGLLAGKPAGILAAAVLSTRLAGARLPAGAGWLELAAAGVLAGIGFTVSLFITDVAFGEGDLASAAKLGVLIASAIAAVAGAALLAARPTAHPLTGGRAPEREDRATSEV